MKEKENEFAWIVNCVDLEKWLIYININIMHYIIIDDYNMFW